MMNKKDYTDAVDEIKADQALKKKTVNKIVNRKVPKIRYKLINAVIVILVVFSVFWTYNANQNNEVIHGEDQAKQQLGLPTIDSLENLINILNSSNSSNTNRSVLSQDSMLESANPEKSISDTASSNDYSQTNVQVAGVDEADIVKTDGEYIYYLSNTKLVIVDARIANDLKIVKEIEYTNQSSEQFSAREIYVYRNKLIVIGYKNQVTSTSDKRMQDSIYYGSNQFTKVFVYDIKNKQDIKVVREVEIDGYYLSSRMIQDNLYLVTNQYLYPYAILRNEKIKEDDLKPLYKDTLESNEYKKVEFANMCYIPGSEETNYLNIAGFNIEGNSSVNVQTILGAGNIIYASETHLYIAKTKYEYNQGIVGQFRDMIGMDTKVDVKTQIYKYKLDGSNIIYKAAGQVPGYIINQFAMDEYEGNFRIATTNQANWNMETNDNNLYILDGNLEVVGQVEGLAKGEKIYSVRFMGKKAYVVTFKQVDPLFVIDVADPANPTVLGELKIPGYSDYLHPYSENYLIGFGQETETINYSYGEQYITIGMKMALFDVTDPSNPKEVDSVKIGDKGTYSELLNNHKALLFSKEKNIIAFPISITKNQNGSYYTNLTFQGAILYGMNLDENGVPIGFAERGRISHKNVQNGYQSYSYEKAVERILYINNTLFTLSKSLIKATDLNTMKEIGALEIEIKNSYYDIMPYQILE